MQIPAQFLHVVAQGAARRYGCIIKDQATGRILGHLKEVGKWANALPSLPLNPVSTAVEIAQWLSTQSQLSAIRETLHHLQLMTSVGAAASVAGLGVSAVGFGLVLRRLERLEEHVNAGIHNILVQIDKLGRKMTLLVKRD